MTRTVETVPRFLARFQTARIRVDVDRREHPDVEFERHLRHAGRRGRTLSTHLADHPEDPLQKERRRQRGLPINCDGIDDRQDPFHEVARRMAQGQKGRTT